MRLSFDQWIFFVFSAFLWQGSLFAQEKNIASVDARFDIAQAESYVNSVVNYLSRYLGKKASEQNSTLAEDFLRSLYFVATAQCNYLNDVNLVCYIKSKRIIRAIKINGLPASLLEEELRRKLPIQVGHTVDLDEKFQEVLFMVKSRVETFLKKNGFFGATVLVQKDVPNDSTFLAIDVKIEGGVFVRVNDVTIYGDPPMSGRAIKKLYTRMCFSPKRIIESISLGTLNCYSRELESDTTQSLRERFAKMGYVQARIYISHHWVNPHDQKAPAICQSKNSDDKTERCINLRIDIDKGPKVSWTVNIKDRLWISRNKFLRFIGSMFSVDQFSRATVSPESDEVALDQLIIKEELEGKITFVSAKNIDEQELNDSAKEITNYLISQGYVNAEVTPSLNQDDRAHIHVNFDVYAGDPHFVDSVKILPEMYREFVSDEDLALLLNVRSIANNGHLSYQEIEAAAKELTNRFNERGFININVDVDLESGDNGKVNVTFYVTSEGRKIIDEIIILNGFNDLNETILPALKNCDKYSRPRRHNRERKLCHDSSLVSHELEEDSNRLADFYQNSGFLYAKAKAEVVTNDTGINRVIFTLYDSRFGENSVVPLKKQEIKDIIVSGNSSTAINVIKRLFPTKRKNALLDPIALKKGLANLRESGRFSRIDQKILAGQQDSDDAYFILQLTERPSLTLDTSIAFSTDQLFSFETELEETNLFSSMLKLNTIFGFGLFWGRQTIFNNKLIWPLIWGKPLRLTLNAPMIVYDDFTHRPGDKAFRRLQSKVSIGLEWKATSNLLPYIRYWLILNQKQSFPQGLVSPSFQERLSSLDGLIPTMQQRASIRGVLKPGLSYIQLDNPFDPRLGVDMNVWTELSGGPILGEIPFINLGTQNRFFFPIGPFTLAFQLTFMRAFIDPTNENWHELRDHSSMDSLGGDRSIRGYDDGVIGITVDKSAHSSYSGYFSNIANMELRFPITTKGSLGNFSGAFFIDQGSLVPCSSLFSCMEGKSISNVVAQKGLGLSIGAALRYSLPVGPISVDYGFSPLSFDNRIHILFGYAF